MKTFVLILVALFLVIGLSGLATAQAVNYDVIIEPNNGENPAVGTWVMFEFGLDVQWAEVVLIDEENQIGRARCVRAAWWFGDWSATIDAALEPTDPPDWDQTQGGANNTMHWWINGE